MMITLTPNNNHKHLFSRRTGTGLILLFLCLQVNISWAQKTAPRKNIDNLTAEELATYKHAIQLLRDRSAEDPYNMEGYAWQAWVHNVNM